MATREQSREADFKVEQAQLEVAGQQIIYTVTCRGSARVTCRTSAARGFTGPLHHCGFKNDSIIV